LPAISGFHYSGVRKELTLAPRVRRQNFRSFWSLPSGWGSFSHATGSSGQRAEIQTAEGSLSIARLVLEGNGKNGIKLSAKLGSETVSAKVTKQGIRRLITFEREVQIVPEKSLSVTLRSSPGG
jgi:hypothetical protein